MDTHHADEERISRMRREGKLTPAEAEHLLESLRAQQARDAALARQIGQRTDRIRRWRLLQAVFGVLETGRRAEPGAG